MGSFGAIYKANCYETKENVAIKTEKIAEVYIYDNKI
jgi:hypothetical protein